jgi:hypothetical protein
MAEGCEDSLREALGIHFVCPSFPTQAIAVLRDLPLRKGKNLLPFFVAFGIEDGDVWQPGPLGRIRVQTFVEIPETVELVTQFHPFGKGLEARGVHAREAWILDLTRALRISADFPCQAACLRQQALRGFRKVLPNRIEEIPLLPDCPTSTVCNQDSTKIVKPFDSVAQTGTAAGADSPSAAWHACFTSALGQGRGFIEELGARAEARSKS